MLILDPAFLMLRPMLTSYPKGRVIEAMARKESLLIEMTASASINGEILSFPESLNSNTVGSILIYALILLPVETGSMATHPK
jgi:hypothetical protein